MTENRKYYTDPIIALYMMKEFGVKFSHAKGKNGWDTYYSIDQEQLCDFITGGIEDFDGISYIFIDGESEHTFEAKEGDQGMVKTRRGKTFGEFKNSIWVYYGLSLEEVKPVTIMRDNKHFFNTEQ